MEREEPEAKVFHYDRNDWQVSPEMKEAFDKEGYVILRNILNEEELTKLKSAVEDPHGIMSKAYTISDEKDGPPNTRFAVWNHPGDDISGLMSRSRRVVDTLEALLGGEVYHYHTKLMMKEAHGGGRFNWHQDYGYWYSNGILNPDMATCFMALDPCTKENGCLQIIPRSHLGGRMDHPLLGDQLGAEMERVELLEKAHGKIYVNLQPGDCVIFHSNTLHRSDRNYSDARRWAFVMAFNRASNNPYRKHHHPRYNKIHKVPDSAILECTKMVDLTGKGFLKQVGDYGLESFEVEDEDKN